MKQRLRKSWLSLKSRSRTRKRSSISRRPLPAVVRSAVLLFLAIAVALTTVPFALTAIFHPETPPVKTGADREAEQGQEEAKEPLPVVDSVPLPASVKVYRQAEDRVETVKFEEYVKGVVASEMPSTFEPEALKAQAVAARTYSLARFRRAKESGGPPAHKGAALCDTVHCQVYQDKSDLKKTKGAKWMKTDWRKIASAVEATKGQLMYYDGQLVEQALFHSSSGGRTENCEDVFAAAVPYLVSVDSPYESEATHKKETVTFSIADFAAKMKAAWPSRGFGTVTADTIRIRSHSSGGRVESMQIGSAAASGKEVRETLGLYSANFTISFSGGNITFTTRGSGHGVGMSQYGANGMAKEGYTYKEILAHYYSGVQVV